MKKLRPLALMCCVSSAIALQCTLPAFSQTAIPRQMSYQGVLREGETIVVDGKYSIQFALYGSSEGGMPLWTEVQTVELRGGLFNVILGQFVALPTTLPTDAWLGIAINNSIEMPRTKLTSVPFALTAGTAQALTPNATGAVLSLNGQQGALELRAADGFEVRAEKGVLTIGKSTQSKEEEILNQGTEWLLAGNTNATTSHWLGTSNDVPLIVKTNNTERLRIQSTGNGNVGIGETNPGSRLTVARTFHLTNAGGAPELKLSASSGSASTTFKTGTQLTSVTYTLPSSAPSSNGQVLTSTTTGLMTWTTPAANLAHFNEGFHNAAPNAAVTVASFTPKLAVPNMDVAIAPKGTGALLADIPDGTAAGGNKRGENAVDLQMSRNVATEVASGWYSTISGGLQNTSSGWYSTISGGVVNTASGWYSTVGGGEGNAVISGFLNSTNHSTIGGGDHNVISSEYPRAVYHSIIGGGSANLINSSSSVISGGIRNAIRAGESSVIGGGGYNLMWGESSVIGGGVYNSVESYTSVIAGGFQNEINSMYSTGSVISGGSDNVIEGAYSAIVGGRGLTLTGSGSFGFLGYNRYSGNEMTVNNDNAAVFGNVDLLLINNDGDPRELRFYASDGAYTAFQASVNQSTTQIYILPLTHGLEGQVLTTNGLGQLSWTSNGTGLEYFHEIRYVNPPNTLQPVHVLNVVGSEDNIDFAIGAKGDGALLRSVPDGLYTGGNKRGYRAVDLQTDRESETQVASGRASIISGGIYNTASGDYTIASGGYGNTASGNYSTVSGGYGNTASGNYSTVSGGLTNEAFGWYANINGGSNNSVDMAYSTIGGGSGNIVQYGVSGVSGYATIGGGSENSVSGDYAIIGGGFENTINDDFSIIAGGRENIVNGQYSAINSGELNSVSGSYSVVNGGLENTITDAISSSVLGGASNSINGSYSIISGGYRNQVSGHTSSIIGGRDNIISGNYSSILGGRGLTLSGEGSVGFLGNNDGTRNMTVSAANTAVFGNVDMWLINNDNTAHELRLYEASGSGTNYTAFKAGAQSADIVYTLPTSAGTNGQVLTTNGSGVLSWTTASSGGLTHFTESRNTSAPNATVPVHQIAATGSETNIDIALTPKGSGALAAHRADGTVAGGNKRGIYAVDLQMSRFLATQVASGGYSTIGGGIDNRASGYASTISGGLQNTSSGEYSTIGGGYNNTSSGEYSTIGGGWNNTSSGISSTISGGRLNTSSGDYSTILGGRGLTLSGSGSVGFLGNNNDGSRNMTVSAANTAVFGNVDMWLINNDNTAHELRLYEASGSGTNYTAFKAGAQSADIVYTLPTSAGTNGQVLTTNGSGVLSWATASGGGLTHFTESRNTSAPNATVPVHQIAATGSETNIDIALTPKGSGALAAHRADGTVAGGNKRGIYAVDLQMSRLDATQAAVGDYSYVGSGSRNRASGEHSIVVGGQTNAAYGGYSTIGGGALNETGGEVSAVLGGSRNKADGDYSSVLGGRGLTLNGAGSVGFLGNNDGSRNMTVSAANTAVFGNVDMWLVNNDNTAHELRLYEASSSGTNYTAFKAGAQSADIVYTLPTSAGSNGQVLTTNGSGVLSWGIVGFQYFSENRNTTVPNTSRPVHQLVVSGAENDIDLALSPKGDGALTASVANGIPSGGNKRGIGAVDWQTRRNAAEFVASGHGSVLAGGTDNTASGMNAVVSGGQGNVAAGTNSAILGGRGLTLSGSGSVGFLGKNTGAHNMNVSAANTAVFGNVDMWLINNDSISRELRFYEKSSAGNHYTGFKAQDQAASITYTLPAGDGSSGQVLTTNGTGSLYWSSAGSGGLTHFTESVNTAAPNTTIPVVRLLATNGATNVDIALSPKGMGALTANLADNTATGGNKRGAKAVDWQMQRTSAVQIANGDHSVIGGGSDNAAIGQYAVAAGGYTNNAAGYASAIGGGAGNFGNASFTTVAGGSTNTASATYASVGGGDDNTASGIYSVVSGGFNNIAAGFSSSINGGNANEVHGEYSGINGGELNIINGDYSAILGGNGLTLHADRSIGYNANNEFGTRAMSVNAPNTAVFNNVDFWLTNNDNTTRSLRFYERYNADGAFPNSTNYIGFKAPNAIAADIVWTLPAADGTNGQVLTTNGSGQLSWASGGATLQNFTETVNTSVPNTSVPVVQFTATNASANVDIALTPKGTGSLAAHSATGSASGGNKRGANAVDWQTLRSLASEIASGTASVIGGGGGNTASATYSTIAGGQGNVASQGYATVGGGIANAANGAYSTVGGGVNNTVSGGSSVIPGGSGLTLSGTGSFGFLSNNAGTNAMSISQNNVAVFANTNLWLANNDANPSELRFYEANTVTSGAFPPAALNFTAFKAQPQTANIVYTLPADDGNAGQVLSTDGTGMLSWADASAGALSHFVESYHNDGNNGAVTVSRLSASTAAANVDIALSPRGVGSLLASLPDGTATGGNKRGSSAVDWQLSRNSNLQIASGNYSVISGGQYNRASSDHAAVGGGIGNNASGQVAIIAGGQNNTASSTWSTVSGGFNNSATGSSSVVVGGFGNIAAGENSTVLGGRGLNLEGSGNIGFLGNNSGGPRNMTVNTSNTAVFGNVDMWLINNDNTAHELRMYEASGDGDNYTAFKAQAQTETIVYTLPATAPPATDYVMTVQESSGNNATLGWGKRIIQVQDTPVDCDNLTGGGGNATVDITVADAVVGGTVHVSPRQAMEGGVFIAYSFIPSNGTVRIMFINATAGDIDPDSVNMDITVIQP